MSSRVGLETDISGRYSYINMEPHPLQQHPSLVLSRTLGELLKRVDDARNNSSNNNNNNNNADPKMDGQDQPHPHHVLEMHSSPSRSLPFVLSFHNLSYSVKSRRRLPLPRCLRRNANANANANATPPRRHERRHRGHSGHCEVEDAAE
ncbi:hypothetical protein Sjap_001682 [Stephania japonica]|uniref:Uncharacterized protein n=1 Tax=Stephania japonica TaxID=461633 RepID=A0AAP0KMQ5_9MAGN